MKTGLSVVELAQELERQQTSKKDFLAPTSKLTVEVREDGKVQIVGLGDRPYGIRRTAHEQFAARTGIPQKYYDRMLETAPGLLAENVNHWFRSEPEKRLVRTLDTEVRALLSDRYRPLDNYELAEAVLPVLKDQGVEVRSSEITDSRMYVQAVLPRMSAEPRRGDVIQAGIVVSNSEIGMGSLRIEPMLFRLICLNGAIATEAIRKYHAGSRLGEGDEIIHLLSDDTRRVTDAAFWMQVRDLTKAAFDEAFFTTQVKRIEEAAKTEVGKKEEEIVEVIEVKFGLNEIEKKSFLRNLLKDGGETQWSVVNAITALANVSDDYDRAIELERAGGEILELAPRNFARLFEKA